MNSNDVLAISTEYDYSSNAHDNWMWLAHVVIVDAEGHVYYDRHLNGSPADYHTFETEVNSQLTGKTVVGCGISREYLLFGLLQGVCLVEDIALQQPFSGFIGSRRFRSEEDKISHLMETFLGRSDHPHDIGKRAEVVMSLYKSQRFRFEARPFAYSIKTRSHIPPTEYTTSRESSREYIIKTGEHIYESTIPMRSTPSRSK